MPESGYKPEYADRARKLSLGGFTNAEIAEFLGISPKTLDRWRDKYDDFKEAFPKQDRSGSLGDFRLEYIEQARKLCELGATDDEVAAFFGVHRSTFYRWRNQHPEFAEALEIGKKPADDRVERSLYGRAVGYRYTEKQAIKVKISQYEERVETVEVERELPPDVSACFTWLKNRRKDEWRDKQEMTHSGDPDNPIVNEVVFKIVRSDNPDT